MKKSMVLVGFLGVATALTGCANGPQSVESSLLDIAVVGEGKESNTASILLSKISLHDTSLARLEALTEPEEPYAKRVYSSYAIAKRTQYWPDIERFIDIASENPAFIITSESDVVGPNNDLMSLLSYYSYKSDKALSTLIRMVSSADGAVLEQLSAALQMAKKGDSARFDKLLSQSGADKDFINQLIMEG
jgi:aconitase B